jgi:hypothetical protein
LRADVHGIVRAASGDYRQLARTADLEAKTYGASGGAA